jgi:hypothetical protein
MPHPTDDQEREIVNKWIKTCFEATKNHLMTNGGNPLAGAYVGLAMVAKFMEMVPVQEMEDLTWVAEFENFKKILDRSRDQMKRPGVQVH